MAYTKEFLISELHRFVEENNRNPKYHDMQSKFGYISGNIYVNNFGSWNKALISAGLKVNQEQHSGTLIGSETCDNCNTLKPKTQNWYYKQGQRLCNTCYKNLDNYKSGKLDSNSSTGFAFISQRVVAKVLGLDLKYDCNCSIGFNSEYDLHDKNNYGTINVKARALYDDNIWMFSFRNKYVPNTYILLGFASNKSDILRVWIANSNGDLVCKKKGIGITNSDKGLKRAEFWEVDAEPYNNAYHTMSLYNCSILKNI